jgi:hypothetical protein
LKKRRQATGRAGSTFPSIRAVLSSNDMSKRPAKSNADAFPALSIRERLLLFCVASDTDWEHAGIAGVTVTAMVVRGMIERDAGGRLSLTPQGQAALDQLLER